MARAREATPQTSQGHLASGTLQLQDDYPEDEDNVVQCAKDVCIDISLYIQYAVIGLRLSPSFSTKFFTTSLLCSYIECLCR